MTPQAHRDGLRLRLYRIALGKTHTEIARDLDVSRAAYYRYERGEIVKLDTIAGIAGVLGLTFEQLTAPFSDDERHAALEAVTPASARAALAA